jgi:MscS family membrane protein
MWEYILKFLWAIQAFIIVFFTMVVAFIEKKVHKKLVPKLERTGLFWDDALVKAVHAPFLFFVWLIGITFAIQVIASHVTNDYFASVIEPARKIGIGLLLIWFLVRFIQNTEENILSKSGQTKFDETSLRAICQILRVSVLITGILILLQLIGIPVTGVLAFGGIGGIAIGFAAKDLLANFFGGLMLFLDRPFRIGDEIKCIEKPFEGIVENIGWRSTRIRTYERRPLSIPNSVFSSIAIENLTRMTNRRIKQVFSIKYKDSNKIADIIQDIEKMLGDHDEIDGSKLTTVDLIEFGQHSLDIEMYTFTKATGFRAFRKVQQDIFLKVVELVRRHDAEIALPQMIVDISKD